MAKVSLFLLIAGVVALVQASADAQFAPASSIAPKLKVAKSNESVTASWLISPFDFALESVTGLPATGAWTRVTTPANFVEAEGSVTMPATNAQEFFRLTGTAYSGGLASLPLFQFALFYNVEMEICPGPVMSLSGAVHCNSNLYVAPGATLTFRRQVTSAGTIYNHRAPLDPTPFYPTGTIDYQGGHRSGVAPLALSFDTNHTQTAVREILNVPPAGESPSSPPGRERFYNKADIVVRITDTATNVFSGLFDVFSTSIPRAQWTNWLDPYRSFFNKRENKSIHAVQIDAGRLRTFSGLTQGTNSNQNMIKDSLTAARGGTNGEIMIVYVKDERTPGVKVPANTEPGVRVVNGALLPPRGLTIATPNPLYVWGNYNVQTNIIGPPVLNSTNTTRSLPAALIGDAITVLSPAWLDVDSTNFLAFRNASATSINAAFLAGIVATTTNNYSGGVENLPRFLEDWAGINFQYNGSLVALHHSIYAVGQWQGTGSTIGIYNPPTRNWAFDQNFRDVTKLPPGTPIVGVLAPGY